MLNVLRTILFGLLVSVFGCACGYPEKTVHAPIMVETDQEIIENALYKIAKPRNWNKKILIIAPGWRPPQSALLAPLNLQAPFEYNLLKSGWVVATTSYRRTGVVVEDGIKDLQNLIKRIEEYYGPAETLIIEGSSMGGALAALVAEGNYFPDHLKLAVVAISVDFDEPGDSGPITWTRQPIHPMLLMSNSTEWNSLQKYTASIPHRPMDAMHPIMWQLHRPGHVNVNSKERLAAVEVLDSWLGSGKKQTVIWPEGWNATIDMSNRLSVAEVRPGNYLAVKVLKVDPVYGNVDVELVQADLDFLKVEGWRKLFVYSSSGRHEFAEVTTYSDVDEGALAGFLTAEGFTRLAINQGNAAQLLDCSVGDELTFYRETLRNLIKFTGSEDEQEQKTEK